MKNTQFRVINGTKHNKPKKDKEEIKFLRYDDLFHYHMAQIMFTKSIDNIKQCIYYGVQYIKKWTLNYKQPTFEEISDVFQELCLLEEIMGLLTYNEFINIFPPIKEYDGEKYGCKDYWFTKQFLEQFNLNTEIGSNIDMFLMDYYSSDIVSYNVGKYMICDLLRRAEGKPSILESCIEEQNLPIDTYTYNKTHNYMQNQRTGKTQKVSKPKKNRPEYLKIVK